MVCEMKTKIWPGEGGGGGMYNLRFCRLESGSFKTTFQTW